MKILFATSESFPFIKTGGLGDVSYALPKALRQSGIDVRVIIPKYSQINEEFRSNMKLIKEFRVNIGYRNQYVGLQYMEYDGVIFYIIDNEYYFKRNEGIYGYYDEAERWAYFSRAVLESIKHFDDFSPDIIHCNDWQTATIIPMLKEGYAKSNDDIYKRIKTVFTIHNIEYQGIFNRSILGDLLGFSDEYFIESAFKYNHDSISYMKVALNYADKISTVSPTYAEEIKTAFYGKGLEEVVSYRHYDLFGIVNGIDYDIFSPETDINIYAQYNDKNLKNKIINKKKLQKELNLPVNAEIPMIGIVSRLVSQKGIDLIECVIEDILKMDVQLVVLGTGDTKYEDMFRYFAYKYPDKLSANIYYGNELSSKIYAASDMFLMPSLFEPCGLGQLIALRYGSIPIVRETGGLKDTIESFNEFTGEGNGFSFKDYNAHDMLYTIERAINFYKDKKVWDKLTKRAIKEDNTWNRSAEKYIELYSYL